MTATLHQPGSLSTRKFAETARAAFPPTLTPARPIHDAQPVGPFATPGSRGAQEIGTDIPRAVPELGSFDQEELNDNPVFHELCPMPLIGALLLDRQLITRTQLDTCLLLQQQMYPHMPIGQILVHKGYLSQAALDQTLSIQAEIRASLSDVVSRVESPPLT